MFQLSQIVGTITTPTPLAVSHQGSEYYATASTARAFILYRVDTLSPVAFSPEMPDAIALLAVCNTVTAVSFQHTREVHVFRRAELAARIAVLPRAPLCLLTIGNLLVPVTATGEYTVYDLARLRLLKARDLRLRLEHENEEVAAVCHPDGYLNKIVVLTATGRLELHNIDKNKRVYSFGVVSPPGRDGAARPPAPFTALAAGNTLDVVALFGAPCVALYHLKERRVLFTLFPDAREDVVTAVLFLQAAPLLVAGTAAGRVVVFHLEHRRVVATFQAHAGRVTSLHLIPDTYILTSGADNAIRLLNYDVRLQAVQPVKHRTGHRGVLALARFYTESAAAVVRKAEVSPFLLTVGADDRQMRYTQIFRRNNSELFVQAANNPNGAYRPEIFGEGAAGGLPAIRLLAASELRDEHWGNVLTAHKDEDFCHVWAFFRNTELTAPMQDAFLGKRAVERKELQKLRKDNGGVLPQAAVDAMLSERRARRYHIALPSSASFAQNALGSAELADALGLSIDDARLALPDAEGLARLAARLRSSAMRKETVTACAISPDGHFCCIGGSAGSAAVYNLQSGRLVSYAALPLERGGPASLVGVHFTFDSAEVLLVSSAGAYGRFARGTLACREATDLSAALQRLPPAPAAPAAEAESEASHSLVAVTATAFSACNGLLAVGSLESLFIVDAARLRVARVVPLGSDIGANCLAFADNGRRVLYATTVAEDAGTAPTGLLTVYDIVLGQAVCRQFMMRPITSLSVGSNDTVLALVYMATEGVYIYRNLEKYGLNPLCLAGLRATAGAADADAGANADVEGGRTARGLVFAPDTLFASSLATLTTRQAEARESLAQFGGGLQRAAATKRAPFYIGLAPGLPAGAGPEDAAEGRPRRGRAPRNLSSLEPLIHFPAGPAQSPGSQETHLALAAVLEELAAKNTPSGLDLDVRLLASAGSAHGDRDLLGVLRFVDAYFSSSAQAGAYPSCDLVCAIYLCCLKYHALAISHSPECVTIVARVRSALGSLFDTARDLAYSSTTVLGAIST